MGGSCSLYPFFCDGENNRKIVFRILRYVHTCLHYYTDIKRRKSESRTY